MSNRTVATFPCHPAERPLPLHCRDRYGRDTRRPTRRGTPSMKITSVDTFVITNRRILVRIGTDTGLAGWGEPTLEGWSRPIAAVVEQMANYVIGQDPRRITHHWQVLGRGGVYRGGPLVGSALAGIDQ